MKTQVSFKCGAFNTAEERDYFINPGNFGDDLAEWMMAELQRRGFVVDGDEGRPGQEDFGWYFSFGKQKPDATFLLGHRDETHGEWLGWVERNAGFLSSIFGGRNRGTSEDAVSTVDEVLRTLPDVSEIRWTERGEEP